LVIKLIPIELYSLLQEDIIITISIRYILDFINELIENFCRIKIKILFLKTILKTII
jgi:hypothetical protein